MWDAAQGALEDLLEDEYPTMQLRPQKDRLQVFQTLATFYLRYLKIFRALEEVYDQIVHPQKRRVVHQVLEGVMGRLVELKNEMVELEYSEFHYFDDILQDFKMTPVSEITYCYCCMYRMLGMFWSLVVVDSEQRAWKEFRRFGFGEDLAAQCQSGF